jgi:proteasome lid subunit RPN8/RPN11
MEDGPSDNLSEGPSYFGYVRDERGSSVMRAAVTLQPKTGNAVQTQANVMGAYRSHVNANTKPEDVDVTCAKSGYTFVRAIRRPTSTARVVEIDCQMKRN